MGVREDIALLTEWADAQEAFIAAKADLAGLKVGMDGFDEKYAAKQEAAATMSALRRYWRQVREAVAGGPTVETIEV